jgi:hypothetical protein
MKLSTYRVMAATHHVNDGWRSSDHKPTFLITAFSPEEAIKIAKMIVLPRAHGVSSGTVVGIDARGDVISDLYASWNDDPIPGPRNPL